MGSDLNLCDNEGVTPLIKAWPLRHHVSVLIKFGCSVNLCTSSGLFPLELATTSGDFQLVGQLLAAGANPAHVDFDRHSNPHNTKYCSEFRKLRDICRYPTSLKGLCRICVRSLIKENMFKGVQSLPLPRALKEFLLLGNVCFPLGDSDNNDCTTPIDLELP